MSDEQAAAKQKFAWSSIAGTILTGLLLSAFNYVFSSVGTYMFSDRADIYLVERPLLPDSKFQKLLIIDNFSSNAIGEVHFSLTAENVSLAAPVNLEKFEQTTVGPRTVLIKLTSVLPNRQASLLLQSDVPMPDESLRVTKAPAGIRYKSKDKIFESWFDWSQFVSAFIQFGIYVAGMLYFERRMAAFKSEAEELRTLLERRNARMDEERSVIVKLKNQLLRMRLTQVRQIMSLTRENRLWRKVAIGILEASSKNEGAAKKLLRIILIKAGIKPRKEWEDYEDEELIEIIQEAETELVGLPKI